jgi:hypothetical protein
LKSKTFNLFFSNLLFFVLFFNETPSVRKEPHVHGIHVNVKSMRSYGQSNTIKEGRKKEKALRGILTFFY